MTCRAVHSPALRWWSNTEWPWWATAGSSVSGAMERLGVNCTARARAVSTSRSVAACRSAAVR
ncbi:hypothetical protein ACFFX0_25495 [Citricoccus parietis]|uniref:Uncharacterized protein n=1 Tax=Citricoccus parietis TaxID=592307 RepID=A0ABV5G5Z1_9MICC